MDKARVEEVIRATSGIDDLAHAQVAAEALHDRYMTVT